MVVSYANPWLKPGFQHKVSYSEKAIQLGKLEFEDSHVKSPVSDLL